MEAISSSETSGATQRITRRHIQEDDTLHNHRCETSNPTKGRYCLHPVASVGAFSRPTQQLSWGHSHQSLRTVHNHRPGNNHSIQQYKESDIFTQGYSTYSEHTQPQNFTKPPQLFTTNYHHVDICSARQIATQTTGNRHRQHQDPTTPYSMLLYFI
jgi:hypothetical protein